MIQKIKRIGERNISEEALTKAVSKNLGFKLRLNQKINTAYIEKHTAEKMLIYHPYWIVKTLVVAARSPFPPKKLPQVIFVDGVSGYKGVFSHVPPVIEEEMNSNQLLSPELGEIEIIEKYVVNVQEKQINRQYMLKKNTSFWMHS